VAETHQPCTPPPVELGDRYRRVRPRRRVDRRPAFARLHRRPARSGELAEGREPSQPQTETAPPAWAENTSPCRTETAAAVDRGNGSDHGRVVGPETRRNRDDRDLPMSGGGVLWR
jgi:hypothetical protein